jgi:hypothetical protein
MLSDLQKTTAQATVNIFETGSAQGQCAVCCLPQVMREAREIPCT